jgi:arginyl-tRNA synthetase
MNAFKQDIVDFLARETPLSAADVAPLVETPPDSDLGDYAFPCFRLAKELRMAPPKIAADLASKFTPGNRVKSAEPAGPYVNFRLDRARYFEAVLGAPAAGTDEGAGKTIVLDYASPNISKQLAYHHLPSSCIGFSLKRIFDHLGYRTVGINHLGDWGTTHGKLIAAIRRWGQDLDLSTADIATLNRLYVRFNEEGDDDEGREWFRRLEEGDPEARALWQKARDISVHELDEMFDRLGITFDLVKGESEYIEDCDAVIEKIEAAGLAERSEGALIVRLPGEDLPPLFLRKADGSTVYATRDLAAAIERFTKFGFSRCLYVIDMGQALHLKQFATVLSMMGYDWADRLEFVGFGLVRFGGKKTGTRTGNVVLLRDVLTEAEERIRSVVAEKNPDLPNREEVARKVGVGAIIFSVLATRRVKDVDITFEDILNFEGHTGPYVQYTHARCASILRRAGEVAEEPDPGKLTLPAEWEVAKLVGAFPDRVALAAREAEPSIVAQYLLSLCEAFSRYYNLGNEDPELKVLTRDAGTSAARLALVDGVRMVLERGLWLLGIHAPEEM